MEGSHSSQRRTSILLAELGEIDNKSEDNILSNSNEDTKSSEANIIECVESADEESQIMNESKEGPKTTRRNSESSSPHHDKNQKSSEMVILDYREASKSVVVPEQQQLQKTPGSRRGSVTLKDVHEELPVDAGSVRLINVPEEPGRVEDVVSPSGPSVDESYDDQMSCGSDSHVEVIREPILPEKIMTRGGDEEQEDHKEVIELGRMQVTTPGEMEETPGEMEERSSSISVFSDECSSVMHTTKVDRDCDFCFKHRWSCFFCWHFLLAVFCVCFYLAPHPLDLCLRFTFNNEDIADKVLGDEGSFQLEIKNPNILPIDVNLEIAAYSGGVEKQNIVMKLVDHSVFAVDGRSSKLENGTYVFAQNSTAFVSVANAYTCSEGLRTDLAFDLVLSFNGCMLSFICLSNVVSEFTFLSECPGHNNWMCTELDIFG